MEKIIRQALLSKSFEPKVVEDLLSIMPFIDSEQNNYVLAHILLGLYEKPNIPMFLYNERYDRTGVVLNYNPITDIVSVEYDHPVTETWYYATKEDRDADINGTTNWSTAKSWNDYHSAEKPNGKTTRKVDDVKWSDLMDPHKSASGKNYGNTWILLSTKEAQEAEPAYEL